MSSAQVKCGQCTIIIASCRLPSPPDHHPPRMSPGPLSHLHHPPSRTPIKVSYISKIHTRIPPPTLPASQPTNSVTSLSPLLALTLNHPSHVHATRQPAHVNACWALSHYDQLMCMLGARSHTTKV